MLLALSKSYTVFTIWSYAPSISSLLLLSNGILSTTKWFFFCAYLGDYVAFGFHYVDVTYYIY